MWYILCYEKTHVHPFFDYGRTADPAGGPAVVQCLCVTPLPNLVGQCAGPDGPRDWRDAGLRRSNRPQRHSRVPYPWAHGVNPAVLCPPADPACDLYSAPMRAAAHAVAPEPPHLWLPHQSVDLAFSRRGGVCPGTHVSARQWRSHPPGPGAPRCPLEAGQTLDHQSRSRVHPKKKRRDRLMALATTHPTWGLGFGDEVWWSRLAQPALHTWAPDAQALRLVEQARPKADPEPKALACYGLLVRRVPTEPEQMLLRFVERRPVSCETTAFLA